MDLPLFTANADCGASSTTRLKLGTACEEKGKKGGDGGELYSGQRAHRRVANRPVSRAADSVERQNRRDQRHRRRSALPKRLGSWVARGVHRGSFARRFHLRVGDGQRASRKYTC